MRFLILIPLIAACSSNCTGEIVKDIEDDAASEIAKVVTIADTKIIKLINFEDKKIQQEFDSPAKEIQYNGIIKPFLSPAIDLGMSNVPVLDQGQEGTCVTFSSTAALDAIIGEGDFISQQCSLELDLALGNNYWNGANYPSQVIVPLQQWGIVSQSDCPTSYANSSASIDIYTYQSIISSNESSIVANVDYEYFPTPNLSSLKTSINQGYRVLIGFHINTNSQQSVQGFNINGGIGGLWACQQSSSPNYCTYSRSGHEVLVIGYDDSQQLLKIRNSWGNSVGQQGDYFMTYSFFSAMAEDMTVIK